MFCRMVNGPVPEEPRRGDDWYRAQPWFFFILTMNKRFHIYYSGSVQGVGFRYVAQSAAQQLGVAGWVKNLEDGRVEMVCEADETALNNFLDRIRNIFGQYIRDADMGTETPKGKFEGFDIKF